jgi:phosphoribosylamine-glycine ligase
MKGEPSYQVGELLYDKENQRILQISERMKDIDAENIFKYRVTDFTHTNYELYIESDLKEITTRTGIALLYSLKPSEYFDKEELENKIKNHKRFPNEN